MIEIQIVSRGEVECPWLDNEGVFDAALTAVTAEARMAGSPQLIELRPKRG